MARDGEPDAASALFGRKEGDEDVVGLFRRDGGAVIADFNQDRFVAVEVGIELDFAVRALVADGLHGVFQQVQDDL